MPSTDRIERIELFHVEIPLATPFFPIWVPGYAQTHLRATLIRIRSRDGHVGVATGAAFGREREGLGDIVGPFFVGVDPLDLEGVQERLDQAAVLGWRNAWIATAFWDLAARARGIPLWQLIAEKTGLPRRATPPARLPAVASFGEWRGPSAWGEAVERALRAGFRGVKLGLDGDTVEEDEAVVRAVASAGTEALYLHGHQRHRLALVTSRPHWSLERALTIAEHAARLGASWLAEPLSPELPADQHVELRRRSAVPIALGDFLASPAELAQVDAPVLTPDASVAGLGLLTAAIGRAHREGLTLAPRAFADGLGVLTNLHVIAAHAAVDGKGGLAGLRLPWDPPSLTPGTRDALLAQELHVDLDGTVAVPTGPGLGLELSERGLRRFARRFCSITPIQFAVSSARRTGLSATRALTRPEKVRAKNGRSRSAGRS